MANSKQNIRVEADKGGIRIHITDPVIAYMYEKSCGGDPKKIIRRISDFLSRN